MTESKQPTKTQALTALNNVFSVYVRDKRLAYGQLEVVRRHIEQAGTECEQELARTKGENIDLVRHNQELEQQMEAQEAELEALEETVDRQQKELARVQGKYAVETAKDYRPCRLTHEQFNALQDAVEKSGHWGPARDLLVVEGE